MSQLELDKDKTRRDQLTAYATGFEKLLEELNQLELDKDKTRRDQLTAYAAGFEQLLEELNQLIKDRDAEIAEFSKSAGEFKKNTPPPPKRYRIITKAKTDAKIKARSKTEIQRTEKGARWRYVYERLNSLVYPMRIMFDREKNSRAVKALIKNRQKLEKKMREQYDPEYSGSIGERACKLLFKAFVLGLIPVKSSLWFKFEERRPPRGRGTSNIYRTVSRRKLTHILEINGIAFLKGQISGGFCQPWDREVAQSTRVRGGARSAFKVVQRRTQARC